MPEVSSDALEEALERRIRPLISDIQSTLAETDSQMHIYWAKKPFNITAKVIQELSKPGEIVFDPFLGSGTTVIEALKAKRKAIGIDLNPLAIFITKAVTSPVKRSALLRAWDQVVSEARAEIEQLYVTRCPRCGKRARVLYTIYDKASLKSSGKPVKMRYVCNACGKAGSKPPSAEDKRTISALQRKRISQYYPRRPLLTNTRINVHKESRVDMFFTRRNLTALSKLFQALERTPDSQVRDLLRYTFSSSLRSASKMMSTGGGLSFGFWIPKKGMKEINVWYLFEKKFKQVLQLNDSMHATLGEFRCQTTSFDELRGRGNILLLTQSSTSIPSIPVSSIDLIVTDPPYGDEVPYLELSELWCSWLDLPISADSYRREIVLTDSPDRPERSRKTLQGLELYSRLLGESLSEMYRVLKPGRFACIWFHEAELRIWSSMITAAKKAGFEYVDQTPVKARVKSFKPIVSPGGTLKGHVLVFFVKPTQEKEKRPRVMIGELDVEELIVSTAQQIIASKGGEATTTELYDEGIMTVLNRHGLIPELISRGYDDLRPVFQKHFDYVDGRWRIREEDIQAGRISDRIGINDRLKIFVPSIADRLDKERGSFTFDEFYTEKLLPLFKNGRVPEKESALAELRKYAVEKDGKWTRKRAVYHTRLGTFFEEAPETQHSRLLLLLADMGAKNFGVTNHIGRNERMRNPSLKALSLPELPQVGLRETGSRILEQIDVLWFKKGVVVAAFEVEDTTQVYSGLARMADLTIDTPNISIRTFIVAPREKLEKVRNEFKRAVFRDIARKQGWRYILYDDLIPFYSKIAGDRKYKLDIGSLDRIAQDPFGV